MVEQLIMLEISEYSQKDRSKRHNFNNPKLNILGQISQKLKLQLLIIKEWKLVLAKWVLSLYVI